MQLRMFFPRLLLAVLALLALVALAACGSPAAPKAPAQPVARGTAAPANPPAPANSPAPAVVPTNPPVAQNNPPAAQPTAPSSASGEGVKPGGEGTPGGEGAGSPEGGPSIPSVTNPGGLPPSPQTNDPTLSQLGEEKMVVYHDPQNRYQILFVNGWTTGAGDAPGSVKSAFQDRSAQIAVVNSGGKSPTEYATADETQLKSSVAGYQTIVLKPGQIPSGPVVSLIYRYQAGQNPVTGKSLTYIAARVYAPRQGSNDLAIITVTGPAPFYGDLTEIFDRIVTSFKWL